MLQGSLHHLVQFIQFNRFFQVVARPLPHGFHGSVDGSVGGQQHNFHLGVEAASLLQHAQPVHAVHAKIGQDQVDLGVSEEFQAGGPVLADEDLVALLEQVAGQGVALRLVVVDHQNGLLGHVNLLGSIRSSPSRRTSHKHSILYVDP